MSFKKNGVVYGRASLRFDARIAAFLACWIVLMGGAWSTRELLGVGSGSKSESEFDAKSFQGARIPAGSLPDEFDALIDERGTRVGELLYLKKTVSEDGTVKIPLAAPIHGASNALVLHNMGPEFKVIAGDLVYSKLTAGATMIFPVGVALYDYSAQSTEADPGHIKTMPSFWWRLSPIRDGCKKACVIYVEKPWAIATGRPGSLRHRVSEILGAWGFWDLAEVCAAASLALFASWTLFIRRPRWRSLPPLRVPASPF